MKKNAALLLLLLLVLCLSACSAPVEDKYAGYPENVASIMHTIDDEGNSADLIRSLIEGYSSINNDGRYDTEIINLYHDLYAMDGMEESDYSSLADIYISEGNTALAVDTLEKQYRLYRNDSVLQILSGMVTDVTGSDDNTLIDIFVLGNMLYSGNYGEAVKIVLSDDWFETLRPRTLLNFRNYKCSLDDGSVMYLAVGYDEYYQKSTRAFLRKTSGTDVSLQVNDTVLSLLECDVSDGFYNGNYILSQLNLDAKTAFIDRGTFIDNHLTGEYDSFSCWDVDTSDVLTAWDNIEILADEHYSGCFDEEGHAMAEQRSDDAAGSIIYAYNDADTYYLNIVPEGIDDTDEYVFGIDVFRIRPVLQIAE